MQMVQMGRGRRELRGGHGGGGGLRDGDRGVMGWRSGWLKRFTQSKPHP